MSYDLKELNSLVKRYYEKYPDSENPIDYLEVFGLEGVYHILKNANGRRIHYKADRRIIDKVEVFYVDPGNGKEHDALGMGMDIDHGRPWWKQYYFLRRDARRGVLFLKVL